MYKLYKLVLLVLLTVTGSVYAEMKIAVLNYQTALLESNAAKKYAADAEKKFGPQLKQLKTLEDNAKKLQDRLVKDGAKMKQADRERLELELNQKVRDLQYQSKTFTDTKMKSDQAVLAVIKPKLDKAVEEVINAGDYDLILEAGAVVNVKPKYDITKQVIDRLNKLR